MTDPGKWQEQFPVTRNWIYLDIANKAPLPLVVRNAWHSFLDEQHYSPGDKDSWKQRSETLRAKLAALIGARVSEIGFVKNTSEGLNTIAQSFPWRVGDSMVVHAREHPNNLHGWRNLRRRGVEVRVVESAGPTIDLDDILAGIGQSTRMVAVSAVSYRTGQRFDLERLGEMCRRQKALLVVDAVQAIGTVAFDVNDPEIDALACGPQKGLLCTHGLGFLWCRESLIADLIPPFAARSSLADQDSDVAIPDFHADARRFEHGNINYGGVHALEAAVDLIGEVGIPSIHDRVQALTGRLMDLVDRKGLSCITPRADRERAGIVTIGMNDAPQRRDQLLGKRFVVNAVEDGLRVAPHFYNNECELEALVDAL